MLRGKVSSRALSPPCLLSEGGNSCTELRGRHGVGGAALWGVAGRCGVAVTDGQLFRVGSSSGQPSAVKCPVAQCHAWLLGNPPLHTHTLTHRSHLVRLCLGGHPTRGAWPAIAQTGKEMKLPEPRYLSQCHVELGCDAVTGVSA